MKQISFTIYGNQEDPSGNPIPKIRKTRGQQWSPEAQRYVAWKAFVQMAYKAAGGKWQQWSGKKGSTKPIVLGKMQEAEMFLRIEWGKETHGDPESIFGSIADALFFNDKHVSGGFIFAHSRNKKGRVKVQIIIHENESE